MVKPKPKKKPQAAAAKKSAATCLGCSSSDALVQLEENEVAKELFAPDKAKSNDAVQACVNCSYHVGLVLQLKSALQDRQKRPLTSCLVCRSTSTLLELHTVADAREALLNPIIRTSHVSSQITATRKVCVSCAYSLQWLNKQSEEGSSAPASHTSRSSSVAGSETSVDAKKSETSVGAKKSKRLVTIKEDKSEDEEKRPARSRAKVEPATSSRAKVEPATSSRSNKNAVKEPAPTGSRSLRVRKPVEVKEVPLSDSDDEDAKGARSKSSDEKSSESDASSSQHSAENGTVSSKKRATKKRAKTEDSDEGDSADEAPANKRSRTRDNQEAESTGKRKRAPPKFFEANKSEQQSQKKSPRKVPTRQAPTRQAPTKQAAKKQAATKQAPTRRPGPKSRTGRQESIVKEPVSCSKCDEVCYGGVALALHELEHEGRSLTINVERVRVSAEELKLASSFSSSEEDDVSEPRRKRRKSLSPRKTTDASDENSRDFVFVNPLAGSGPKDDAKKEGEVISFGFEKPINVRGNEDISDEENSANENVQNCSDTLQKPTEDEQPKSQTEEKKPDASSDKEVAEDKEEAAEDKEEAAEDKKEAEEDKEKAAEDKKEAAEDKEDKPQNNGEELRSEAEPGSDKAKECSDAGESNTQAKNVTALSFDFLETPEEAEARKAAEAADKSVDKDVVGVSKADCLKFDFEEPAPKPPAQPNGASINSVLSFDFEEPLVKGRGAEANKGSSEEKNCSSSADESLSDTIVQENSAPAQDQSKDSFSSCVSEKHNEAGTTELEKMMSEVVGDQ